MKKQLFLFALLFATSMGLYAQSNCSAAFTYTSSPGGVYTFSATNVVGNPASTMYTWMLGNGTAASGSTITTTYNAPGTYTVCLFVQDTIGTCADSTCVSFTFGAGTGCDASFAYSYSSGGSVSFTALGTAVNPASTMYNWSFDGGATWSGGGSATSTTNTFAPGASVTVLLAIANQGNTCVDTSSLLLNMPVSGTCSAAFSYVLNPNGSLSLSATNMLNNPSSTTYAWTVGTTVSANGATANVYPNAVGNITVCLFIYDTITTCGDSVCQTVNVGSGTVTCNADFSYTVLANNTTQFNTTYASSNASTTIYNWSFDGGTTWANLGASPNYTLPNGTTSTVLCAISNPGTTCVDTFVTSVSVALCNASFYIYPDSNSASPSTYIGVNTSTGAGLSYNWTWGDGTSSTGMNPSHTYAQPGMYNICLAVSSNALGGCIDSFCLSSLINKTGRALYSVTFGASPAGTGSVSKTELYLVPNPTNSSLFVKGNQTETYQVKLFDISGRLVFSSTVKGQEMMNISHLPNSIYSARIVDAKGNAQTVRVAKN